MATRRRRGCNMWDERVGQHRGHVSKIQIGPERLLSRSHTKPRNDKSEQCENYHCEAEDTGFNGRRPAGSFSRPIWKPEGFFSIVQCDRNWEQPWKTLKAHIAVPRSTTHTSILRMNSASSRSSVMGSPTNSSCSMK